MIHARRPFRSIQHCNYEKIRYHEMNYTMFVSCTWPLYEPRQLCAIKLSHSSVVLDTCSCIVGGSEMARRWFKHGKWPLVLVRLHYYSMISFLLLLASGLALYLPVVHTPLIPFLPYIYTLHIVLGIVFAITLITPFFSWIPLGKRLWRFDWSLPLVFGTGIVLTGVLLWKVTWFPAIWRSTAFRWHGNLSYILGGWLVIHGIAKTVGWRPAEDGWAGQTNPSRRQFLTSIVAGGGGTIVLMAINPLQVLRIIGTVLDGSGKGNPFVSAPRPSASRRFAAYYTVTGGYPTVSLQAFRLTVDGLVAHPRYLAWDALKALPKFTETVDFQCVTGWSVANVHWEGVHLKDLVNLVHPHPNAKYVHFHSFDGQYTESLSLEEALGATVLLAYTLNGAPLPVEQGAPLRLVVPTMYGYKSIKWVNRVSFAAQPLVGYWEQRGYANEAFIGQSGLL